MTCFHFTIELKKSYFVTTQFFLPQKCQNNNTDKMCLNQFSAFMLFMFMQKIKRFNASNGYEKPHFGPFCPHPFWSKNLKTRFFPKVILFNYNLFCCNFMQKIRKVPCIEFWIIPEKPHIGPIVGHFWPQNFKNKFILKNFFLSILSSYDVMSCKKSQNSSKH